MPATATALTAEQFLALPEEQQFRRELIHGEIVEMGNARLKHEVLKARVNRALSRYCDQFPAFEVFSETLFVASSEDACIPDVSLVKSDWLGSSDWERQGQGAPLIAVEVVSSEPATRVNQKAEIYLTCGSASVWTVYPETRTVTIEYPDGRSRRLHLGEEIDEPEIIPGFSLRLDSLFEGM